MKKLILLLTLVGVPVSASLIPLDDDSETALLSPVPASGRFVAGPLVFADFSPNILSGLIDAKITVGPPPRGLGLARYIDFIIQPTSPELGWSYSVTAYEPVNWISLPQITHVGSGSPIVTEHFCTVSPCTLDDYLKVGSLTTSTTAGSGFAGAKAPLPPLPIKVYVKVAPTDIRGGSITAFETVFVTPEPASWLTLPVPLLAIAALRRRWLRTRKR